MNAGLLALIVLVIAVAGFFIGRSRAIATAGGDTRKLHSLSGYYGQSILLFAAVPAFVLMGLWLLAQPALIEARVTSMIAPADIAEGRDRKSVV